MLKLTRKNESGRSMIEMLGVLAIIGVLSVGGIAGYTVAMNSHYANQAVDQARRLAAIVSGRRLTNPSARLLDEELEGNFTMDTSETGSIKLTVTGLSEAVRNRIKDMDLGIADVDDGEAEGSLVFTFNNDLTERGASGSSQGQQTTPETPQIDPSSISTETDCDAANYFWMSGLGISVTGCYASSTDAETACENASGVFDSSTGKLYCMS